MSEGLCQCGCGRKTTIYECSCRTRGMVRGQPRPFVKGHNMWKGGKTVHTLGYVLVSRPEHPNAQHNGYVFEHRLVMEKVIGRYLRTNEQVHHKNHDKTDNRPENLVLCSSIAEHRALHRKRSNGLRLPTEPNVLIKCSCGCGNKLSKYDDSGRPRKFIYGHQSLVNLKGRDNANS